MRPHYGFALLTIGMLCGCAMVSSPSSPGSAPLFQADTSDAAFLQAMHREQEALLSTCAQRRSCDQVHFTRAMVGLFENGEAAKASFQQSIAVAPKGPYADSSTRWIRFLADRTSYPASADKPSGALGVMRGLVRAWLRQQYSASASVASRTGETGNNPTPTVHTLQRKIRDRDKRIAELTDQLSALKRIDLEAHRTAKLSPPRTLSK